MPRKRLDHDARHAAILAVLPATQRDIAERTGLPYPVITRTVGDMAKHGLLHVGDMAPGYCGRMLQKVWVPGRKPPPKREPFNRNLLTPKVSKRTIDPLNALFGK